MTTEETCPMCRRPLPRAGKGYLVGHPEMFLICRDCWKGWVVRNVGSLRKAIHGTVDLRDL
jgi:transposase-like protein